MPPFVPSKRRLSTPPADERAAKKPSLFETADKRVSSGTLQENRRFVERLNDSDDENSSLSDISSNRFEDALPTPMSHEGRSFRPTKQSDEDADEDDEVAWEDAMEHEPSSHSKTLISAPVSGDLEITLDKGTKIGYLPSQSDKKKGPSKIERQIRLSTHCMHVQFLLFHNLIRSGWATDKNVQATLTGQLPPNVKKEVEKWRQHCGFEPEPQSSTPSGRGKNRKLKKNGKIEKPTRDWGRSASRQEKGLPDVSRGDPTIRLLKVLAAYWKKRFTITAPGLRKQGYKPIADLEEEVASFKKGPYNPEEHGELIQGIEGFRRAAKACEGSRDLAAQLFTALIRGLGLEARLVASLQPIGFGWSKIEDISTSKRKSAGRAHTDAKHIAQGRSGASDGDRQRLQEKPNKVKKASQHDSVSRVSRRGKSRHEPIDLSEAFDDNSVMLINEDDDEESVIDVTPSIPRKKPNMNYDGDLPAPTYWTEVESPVTHQVYPVDVYSSSSTVVIGADQLLQFEPRGARADKAKQILAYVIAYSSDGTAKDVTTRYLKRHVWPGRTKGYRIPVEKIPVYNRKGKIKYHENLDWFKQVMSDYRRTHRMRTTVDDLEDQGDLQSARLEKRETETGKDTLQSYKASAEFVLERHLRREEALRPGSKPVKTFATGKGETLKEEPVYSRKDVDVCRTGESWHKEGRAVKAGEHPMKMVPIRAVTLTRKREVEEAERDSGEKPKQGLYARHQTDWIIPPPIRDGLIPKNAYGNIDCFVPTMVPKGATHVPMRGTVKVCKRLEIDFAEAVTGFEFGNKIAVPVIEGVVIAEENEAKVLDEWTKDEEERKIKEEGKREKLALSMWRKWLMGLRVLQRFREEYSETADAHIREEMNPFTNKKKRKEQPLLHSERDDEEATPQSNHINGDISHGTTNGEDEIEGGGFLLSDDELQNPQSESKLEIEVEDSVHSNHMQKTLKAIATPNISSDEDNKPTNAIPKKGPKPKDKPASKAAPSPQKKKEKEKTKKKSPAAIRQKKAPSPSMNSDEDEDEGDSSLSNLSSSSSSSSSTSPPPITQKDTTTRPTPKRKAAQKGQKAITSHYFHHSDDSGSNNDNNESDSDDESNSAVFVGGLEPDLDSTFTATLRGKGAEISSRKRGRRRGRGHGR